MQSRGIAYNQIKAGSREKNLLQEQMCMIHDTCYYNSITAEFFKTQILMPPILPREQLFNQTRLSVHCTL